MFQHTTILLRPDALIRMEGDNMSAPYQLLKYLMTGSLSLLTERL